ncbi:MAG: tRNA (adenosine(37)-N6)-threonylcarbamoyltransferase complex ATPase subunit type 1 TsaE [Candidatus Omnitrophota bacterium]
MRFTSSSVKETLHIGRLLATKLEPGDIICLSGELGSGKTVFTKGIAEGLGIARSKIISPSFVLIRDYRGKRIPLYHFDLYRLKREQDIFNLGYEAYLYGRGVTVIEWADKLKNITPPEFLKIYFKHLGRVKRGMEFSAFGGRYKKLLKELDDNIRD